MGEEQDCLPQIDALKLVRDGTEQGDRFPAALDPKSVPVHADGVAESMLFARALSAHLRHFSSANVVDGDWQGFFGQDVSVALAAAALEDVGRFREVYRSCLLALEDLDNAAAPDVVRANLGWIFGAVGTLARQLDLLAQRLPAEIPLRTTLLNTFRTQLAGPLAKLVSWAKHDAGLAAADRLLVSPLVEPSPHDDYDLSLLDAVPVAWSELLTAELSTDWTGGKDWTDFLNDVAADDGVFGDATGSIFERANTCAGHNLFTGACEQFLKAYARLAKDARADLDRTLQCWPSHEPHYALFLSFLEMFDHARAEMNRLGGRHLDFYYGDVLKLARRPAQPAQAHVLVELAKGVNVLELPAGTAFKAGKDSSKVPITFQSGATLVANRAAVASVMSLYRDAEQKAICANSAARADSGAWHPFRSATEPATLGFSVASHYLRLAEGERKITLRLSVDDYGGVTGVNLAAGFLGRLTAEKGWLEQAPDSVTFTDKDKLEIVLTLKGDAPAITDHVAKVHAAAYTAALPVFELRLVTTPDQLALYESLESLAVSTIALTVDVTGFRSLVLSSDLGPVDASKPFQPFGPAPVVGSAFVIGCPEAFSKNGVTSAKLNLAWRGSPQQRSVALQVLKAGKWTAGSPATGSWMSGATEQESLPDWTGDSNASDDPAATLVSPFSLSAAAGYVKVTLKQPLGHEKYAAAVATYVAKLVAKKKASLKTPYTPVIESIWLDYSATQAIDLGATDEATFTARSLRFHHVTPFGFAEQHGWLRAASEDTSVRLLPLLRHRNALDPDLATGEAVPHEGELYVGLSGVAAPQNVALLFQVLDGSADPLTEKPDVHLHFSYLRDGDWVAFARDEVQDGTSQLLASGVISFAIPAEATTSDMLLPGGLTWLRIAAGERTLAVCSLLAIAAQAVLARFVDAGNAADVLATPLPAGSIAKLVTPLAAVKSVSQPSESFGGRMIEEPRAFYRRISERLRHRDRAVALWDVERLVLEAFPALHRAKCLDHTLYDPTESGAGNYRELAAGHVTVVVIPEVSAVSPGDPLTPYASLAVLEQIDELLSARMSCFAALHVRNPAYERLRVECNVRLRAGCDESFSLNQLRASITGFLAPWVGGSGNPPSFGGRIHRSALINFLEEQACVDYVTDFRLYQVLGDGTEHEPQAVVEGTRAVSVLTSVAAELHKLEAIHDDEEAVVHEECGCAE